LDKGIIDYFKGKRRLAVIALALIVGFVLLIAPRSDTWEEYSENDTLSEYKKTLEAEVASLPSGVKGVGRCRVFITFERGAQYTYKSGELVETRPPLVRGVTVVCSGAESDLVRARLTEMLTALFDIPSNRVAVLKSG
jgi:stage III sporulation protein AG